MTNDSAVSPVTRRSVADDLEAWLDLLTAVASEARWIATEIPIDRQVRGARFLEMLADAEAASFVAVAEHRLVGALGAEFRSGVANLGMLAAADRRGSGTGSALLEAGVGWAVTEGTLRRAIRRNNGELWDAVTMGLVLDTTSPGGEGACSGSQPRTALRAAEHGLRSNGLELRPGKLADAHALAAAVDEPEVHRWLDTIPNPYTVDDACAFLADVRRQWTEGTGAPFVITRGGEVVGHISLRFNPEFSDLAEVGYWVARHARGRGIATTALNAVVEWGFDVAGIRRIELHAAVENAAARAVADKAGFEAEGVKRSWRLLRGAPTDYVLYARLLRCPS